MKLQTRVQIRRAWYDLSQFDLFDFETAQILPVRCWLQTGVRAGKFVQTRSQCVAFVTLDLNGERD